MRAVVLDVPESWLTERARLGLDRYDESWEGVLHMVPAPGFQHQKLGTKLVAFFEPLLAGRGIELQYETEVHRPGGEVTDYRIPDLVFFRADQPGLVTERGLEGAPLAILEIRSPNDETYEKFDFWAKLGVPELIVLGPQARSAEVYRLAGSRYLATSSDEKGRVEAAMLGARFSTIQGDKPKLRVECGGQVIEI